MASDNYQSKLDVDLAEVLSYQRQLVEGQRRWLTMCKRITERRMPSQCWKAIPEEVWRFPVWGSKVVIMRTPEVEQYGSIRLPDQAKRPNELGWVVTVGDAITSNQLVDMNVRGKVCPYGELFPELAFELHPLLLVGELVLFNPYAGKALTTNLTDRRLSGQLQPFLLTSIADVWGPLIDSTEQDWSPEQQVAVGLVQTA